MLEYYPFLKKTLLGAEFIAALVALFYFPKLRHTYWKWFIFYLIFIFIQEFFWKFNSSFLNIRKQDYYVYFGIPIQYLFLFWLYALKSLKSKKKFVLFTSIYLLSFIPLYFIIKKINVVYSINLTIGTLLLLFLIVLEFIKQIKNDDILKFKENKMFYINLGVILSYIGTYPFFAFYDYLSKNIDSSIWDMYYLFFLFSTSIMYLLFTASFIWGKHHSK